MGMLGKADSAGGGGGEAGYLFGGGGAHQPHGPNKQRSLDTLHAGKNGRLSTARKENSA